MEVAYYKELMEYCLKLTDEELMEKYPCEYYRYYQKIQDIRTRRSVGRRIWDGELKKKNIWLHGSPRTGKSKWAFGQVKDCPDAVYVHNINKWWNG